MIFNLVLDTIAEKFIKKASQKGWGEQLQDRSWVNLILFADSYWLVATTPEMMSDMTNEWLRLLGEVGWETPTEDLTWGTAAVDEHRADIRVNGALTWRTGRNIGFKVLGTMIAFDNHFDVEVENRLARATAALWANWELLGCASTLVSKRIQVFRATVEASFFRCAGSWNLSVEQLQRTEGAQSRHLRKMLRLKRDSEGSMTDLITRANSTLIHKLRDTETRHEWWDERCVQLRLEWGWTYCAPRHTRSDKTYVSGFLTL